MLSGNRNFEARVHQSIKANFLMSPPLVVAFALAGTVDIDMSKDPLGNGKDGKPVYLRDIWPTQQEVAAVMKYATDPEMFKQSSSATSAKAIRCGTRFPTRSAQRIRVGPGIDLHAPAALLRRLSMQPGTATDVKGARALGIFGDSVTTDHISPAGAIKPTSPAGKYLQEHGVSVADFNSYGARRGNHEVMMRGTFANVRIKNLMVPGIEGGVTIHQPAGEQMSIYDAAMRIKQEGVPLVVFAGRNTAPGARATGPRKARSCWACKAVIAQSFERIHRANLVGMGVLPLSVQGRHERRIAEARRDGDVSISRASDNGITPMQDVTLTIIAQGRQDRRTCRSRCGSTRRSKSTTTNTAGSCPTFYASCWRCERIAFSHCEPRRGEESRSDRVCVRHAIATAHFICGSR